MNNKTFLLIIFVNLILAAISAYLIALPIIQLQKFNKPNAQRSGLVYYIPTDGLSFELTKSATDPHLSITKNSQTIKIPLYQYNDTTIDTIFTDWQKFTLTSQVSKVIPSENCKYISIVIDLSVSYYSKDLYDTVSDQTQSSSGVVQEFSCTDGYQIRLTNL